MGADTHAGAGAVAVMRRSRAFGIVEIALGEEGVGVFEVRGVIVGCPCVLCFLLACPWSGSSMRRHTYHVERGAGWDGGVLVLNIFDADPGQTDWDDCPEAQDFLHQSGHVWDLFLGEAFLPCITLGIHFHDLFICTRLNILTVRRGKISDAHDKVAWNGVKPGGDHCQTDRFDFICKALVQSRSLGRLTLEPNRTFIEFRFRIFEDIASYTRLVLPFCHLVL